MEATEAIEFQIFNRSQEWPLPEAIRSCRHLAPHAPAMRTLATGGLMGAKQLEMGGVNYKIKVDLAGGQTAIFRSGGGGLGCGGAVIRFDAELLMGRPPEGHTQGGWSGPRGWRVADGGGGLPNGYPAVNNSRWPAAARRRVADVGGPCLEGGGGADPGPTHEPTSGPTPTARGIGSRGGGRPVVAPTPPPSPRVPGQL